MLPSEPKIFYGREKELDNILKSLGQLSPRIAILGGGRMGKTSLARAALHHPQTSAKFKQRLFVSAEAATTSMELAALIRLYVGLNLGKDITKSVVHYFSRQMSCLLILDNLETVWEPLESRAGVEELLSLLAEVEQLGLIVTMRGAERPGQVRWTHPFLWSLAPLSDEAALQTFMEITDNSITTPEMDQIPGLTDYMPLAVNLIAHLADYEGLSNVLARWKTEKTSLLSVGSDRKSNLDASIRLSLSSPRITPHSRELLSLFSILPNGLSDAELIQGGLGIPNRLSCKAVLQATSLVYQDSNKRITLLTPLRDYIQQFLPLSQSHIHAIHKRFHVLLRLYRKYLEGESPQRVVNQITLNLANFHDVLKRGLNDSDSNIRDSIQCILYLNTFYRTTGRDHTPLMDDIPPLLPSLVHATSHLCQMELRANHLGAICSTYLGEYRESAAQLSRAKELVIIGGLCGGTIDHAIARAKAEIHLVKSEYSQARQIFSEVVQTTSPGKDSFFYAMALLNIAHIDTTIGGAEEDFYHNLNTVRESSGVLGKDIIPMCNMFQATVELREGKFSPAQIRFEESWPMGSGQYKRPMVYLGYAYKSKEKLDLHKALLFLGDVFIVNEDEDTGSNLYQVALMGFTTMDVHHSRAQCMLRLGDLASNHGHTFKAITFWKAARPLFERASQVKDVAKIDSRLTTINNTYQNNIVELEILHAPIGLVDQSVLSEADGEDSEHKVPLTV
ncbi:hypothetical protein K438DRAFT_1777131 [Mycena galopus ATCC 62051]|nr:hypothetical protein K438DRAFT_1777131 [Mycena galopus ATCC 62051]